MAADVSSQSGNEAAVAKYDSTLISGSAVQGLILDLGYLFYKMTLSYWYKDFLYKHEYTVYNGESYIRKTSYC